MTRYSRRTCCVVQLADIADKAAVVGQRVAGRYRPWDAVILALEGAAGMNHSFEAASLVSKSAACGSAVSPRAAVAVGFQLLRWRMGDDQRDTRGDALTKVAVAAEEYADSSWLLKQRSAAHVEHDGKDDKGQAHRRQVGCRRRCRSGKQQPQRRKDRANEDILRRRCACGRSSR